MQISLDQFMVSKGRLNSSCDESNFSFLLTATVNILLEKLNCVCARGDLAYVFMFGQSVLDLQSSDASRN